MLGHCGKHGVETTQRLSPMNPARAEVSGTSAARSVSDDTAERARVSRSEIVDAVKGIAIVLMVFGHTEQGCMHRQWWDGILASQAGTIWFVGETTRWDKLPIGLAGSAMLILFCRALDGTGTSRLFVWFGEASIAIFLVAPFCQGFARELVLHLLRTTAPVPQLLIPTVVASVIPALLWWWQKPLHIEWLFRCPRAPTDVLG